MKTGASCSALGIRRMEAFASAKLVRKMCLFVQCLAKNFLAFSGTTGHSAIFG